MTSAALETAYIAQTRPYSQHELMDKRTLLFRKFRLGDVVAQHPTCNHFYLTKKNSKKERDILETNNKDQGNCSVCWRLNKTRFKQLDSARQLVCYYCNRFNPENSGFLTYDKLDLESVFYNWLYEDIIPKYKNSDDKTTIDL
jgi:hypothetical protein